MARIFSLLFVIVPFVEIWLLILVGHEIGGINVLITQILTALLGFQVIRHAGIQTLLDVQAQLQRQEQPGAALLDGALRMLGGILLIIPGYLTDLVALSLFFPPTRALLGWWISSRVAIHPSASETILEGEYIHDGESDTHAHAGHHAHPHDAYHTRSSTAPGDAHSGTDLIRPLALLCVLTWLLACSAPLLAKEKERVKPREGTQLMAFVVLGEKGHALRGETVPVARLLLEHAAGFNDAICDGMTMQNGRGASLRLTVRPNPDTRNMPVTICETALPFSNHFLPGGETWEVLAGSGQKFQVRLPTVNKAPEVALILGDTGCRENKAQTCGDDWPFPSGLAQKMIETLTKVAKPGLVIHVGDFKYRGKNKPKASGDNDGSGIKWSNWKADLFQPMFGDGEKGNLFAMVPWVVARGNHELCDTMGNNGNGWFFLLDPTSPVAGDPPDLVEAHTCRGVADGMSRPYRLDFVNGLSLVVTDTAGLSETKEVCEVERQKLVAWYQEMARQFKKDASTTWLITHKPIWSVQGSCDKPHFGNPTPQAALESLEQHALPENFKLALVGHKHMYARFDINPGEERRRMLQLGIGHGGVVLNNKTFRGCLKHDATGEIKKFRADVASMSRFGFVLAQLESTPKKDVIKGWKLTSLALENVKGPKWGDLKTAETCEYPVKTGKPACEIRDKSLFSKECGSCEAVAAPDKIARKCDSGEDEE
ncbi:MAG: FxsA family protein [Magnetococcus sp. YQC-9]